MAKGVYVGINTEVPVYGDNTNSTSVSITTSNISSYFTVSNGLYYFITGEGGATFTTNNVGIANSIAQTTLIATQNMTISITYSYSSETNYDKFYLNVGAAVVANGLSGPTTTKTYNGTITAGTQIIFKYTKDGSQDSYNDQCTFNLTVVPEKVPVGTETRCIARAVRKMYIGVDGLARKVKKAYVGIGGLAMPFYQKGGTLTKVSSTTAYDSSVDARYDLAATTVGNCAMFGGGYLGYSPWYSSDVVCFSPTLTRTITSLSAGRHSLGATAVGNYAVFAGGEDGYSCRSTVDAFTALGVRSPAADLTVANHVIGATAGSYAIFVPAKPWDNGGTSVSAYDSSLVKNTNIAGLPADYLLDMSGTNINKNLAIFASNYSWEGGSHIFITYDSSLTQHTYTNLSTDGYDRAAASINGRAIFFDGKYEDYYDDEWYDEETGELVSDTSYYYNTVSDVCAIDSSMTLTKLSASSDGRWGAKGVTVDDSFVVFGGGAASSWSDYDDDYYDCSSAWIDVYDHTLTKVIDANARPSNFQYARQQHAAAAVGDYAIFSGGQHCDIDDDNYGSYSEIAGNGRPEIYKLT